MGLSRDREGGGVVLKQSGLEDSFAEPAATAAAAAANAAAVVEEMGCELVDVERDARGESCPVLSIECFLP